MSFYAKSVIFDIADNWGDPTYMGLRSIDFWFGGSKITLAVTDFTTYATSIASSSYDPDYVFDTSLYKTGGMVNSTWISGPTNINQRVICIFNTALNFDQIRVNNFHNNGSTTERGVKNVVINISTDIITSTTYNSAISNSTVIFNNVFDQHVIGDQEDEQILTLIVSNPEISGIGGAVAGGNSDIISRSISVSINTIGGAVGGGDADTEIIKRLIVSDTIGGGVSGGIAIIETEYPLRVFVSQSLVAIDGLAYTNPIGNGNIVQRTIKITSYAATDIFCYGRTYAPRIILKAYNQLTINLNVACQQINSTAVTTNIVSGNLVAHLPICVAWTDGIGGILTELIEISAIGINNILADGEIKIEVSNISGTSLTSSICTGNIIVSAPLLSSDNGWVCNIVQKIPNMLFTGETTIIANGHFNSLLPSVSSSLNVSAVAHGSLVADKVLISGITTSGDDVMCDLFGTMAIVSGVVNTTSFSLGNINQPVVGIYVNSMIDLSTTIIRYTRSCSRA